MTEKLKLYWEKGKGFFSKMSKKTRTLLGVTLAVIVIGAVVLAIVLSKQSYSVLFTGLSAEDTSAILSYLDGYGITDFQVENNDTILVPKNQEAELKAKLLMEGYPNSGFSYSTYLENVGSLSTESDRKTAFLFDLQDRMGAVVRCLEGVKNAWVTIAQGEDRRYVLDSGNTIEASASVLVEMASGRTLTNEQAEAIRNLVARAVSGLTIDNITITDTVGNTYNSGGGSATASDSSQLKLELEEQVNNTVRNSVIQALSPFYGDENLRVSVTSTVDVSRSVGESTTYTEPTWASDGSTGGAGIIGSKVYDDVITRDSSDTTGGVVGTESNSDLSTYVEEQAQPDGSETTISTSGQVDYKVDTNVEQVERTAGVVTDLMVSVSINSSTAGPVDTEMLAGHVARAAGISNELQDQKISILALPFYTQDNTNVILPNETGLPDWVFYAAIGGGALLVLLFVFLLILGARRRKKKRRPAQIEETFAPVLPEEPVTVGADIMNMRSEKSMELRKEIRTFADDNPEIAAQMVRQWLREGEDDHE